MVPVPSIEDCLFGLAWNGGYKIEWAGCVVDLPEGCFVNFLEVNSPSWFAVFFFGVTTILEQCWLIEP